MLVHASKCVGPQSMIKVKEHIAESGFCRVLQQDRNVGIPPSPPSLYLKAQTSTAKQTVFDWKVTKFQGDPQLFADYWYFYGNIMEKKIMKIVRNPFCIFLIVHSFY